MFFTNVIVVRIEKNLELRVVRNKFVIKGLENKGFKKPCGVSEVPFQWTGIRHRLHTRVFRTDKGGDAHGALPDLLPTFRYMIGVHSLNPVRPVIVTRPSR